jgi:hypothetical protein
MSCCFKVTADVHHKTKEIIMSATTNGRNTAEAAAYQVAAVTESIGTPEQARELSEYAFGGMRFVLSDVAESILNLKGEEELIHNRSAYKILMAKGLLDSVERASELGHDTWSGIRIILEEVTAALFDGDKVTA